MKKLIDILTFGDMCVDLIFSGDNIVPEFGQKEKLVTDYSLEMGGSCCIFACQTARLGLKTAVIGKIGKDQFGSLVISRLQEAGVLTEYMKEVDNEKTGISLALNRGQDRAILTYNGTIDAVDINDAPDDLLQKVRHLHIGSYFLMSKIQPHYPEIVRKLKQYGATISLDTNWDPEDKWDGGLWNILPYINILLINENEAKRIADRDDLKQSVDRIIEAVPIVVIKRGEEGTVVFTKDDSYSVRAIPGEVIDTIGAGDSFDGGFIYGFLNGKSIEECAKIACICGSLNIRKSGGVSGQPSLEELSKYYKFK